MLDASRLHRPSHRENWRKKLTARCKVCGVVMSKKKTRRGERVSVKVMEEIMLLMVTSTCFCWLSNRDLITERHIVHDFFHCASSYKKDVRSFSRFPVGLLLDRVLRGAFYFCTVNQTLKYHNNSPTSCTANLSAVVMTEDLLLVKNSMRYSVRSRPAKSQTKEAVRHWVTFGGNCHVTRRAR